MQRRTSEQDQSFFTDPNGDAAKKKCAAVVFFFWGSQVVELFFEWGCG
jgi:hypothetical protein